ncbi:MAG: hypothetical protein ACRCUT_05890 [Spirochaetota bacterium]
MELVVFDDHESEIIDLCLRAAKDKDLTSEADNIRTNIDALIELARAISQYPSILGSRQWGSTIRSVESLVQMLCCNHGVDKLMHIPTKAVLGKGFLIAKINLFFMLKYMADQVDELNEKSPSILQMITNIVFTLMSEEVFLAIIEAKEMQEDIRNRAGFLLANIWEYRLNQSAKDFAPILNSIWEARKALCPAYGTMMGFSEISRMSQSTPQGWINFLQSIENADDAYQSLEEFLFNLTYEEISRLRHEMKRRNLGVVSQNDIESLIGSKFVYPRFDETDPREMYQFFRQRKVNARFRKRADQPGPKKTIEEHLMGYLLSAEDWVINL